MTANKNNDLVEIFAGSAIDAQIVRSLLKDSEIESFLKDEHMGSIAPWQTSPGGVDPVKIIISSSNFEKARLIIEEYINNIK